MRGARFLPISCTEYFLLSSLMREEENAWLQVLGWDYSPIRKILGSLMQQKLLPGYAAVQGKEAFGYAYFLIKGAKGIIGNTFVRESGHSREIAGELLSLCISSLKDLPKIERIEAQIIPFSELSYADAFIREGFRHYPRHYMLLPMDTAPAIRPDTRKGIVRWDFSRLSQACKLLLNGYSDQPDADICSDYRTLSGCHEYLHSIIQSPGCGVLVPEASFMALDDKNMLRAFILGSRVSSGVGMIPQIVVHPDYQKQGLGRGLMASCLESFKALGLGRVALTVTEENQRALDWYRRLGFRQCREFGAFVWDRIGSGPDELQL